MRERFGSFLGARRRDSGGESDFICTWLIPHLTVVFPQTNLRSGLRENFRSLAFNSRSHRPEMLPRHLLEAEMGQVSMAFWVVASRGICDEEVLKRDLVLADQLRATLGLMGR